MQAINGFVTMDAVLLAIVINAVALYSLQLWPQSRYSHALATESSFSLRGWHS